MSERITVSFTRAEYEAALAELRKVEPKAGRGWNGRAYRDYEPGPTLYLADLQDAVRRMENADRHLKVVS